MLTSRGLSLVALLVLSACGHEAPPLVAPDLPDLAMVGKDDGWGTIPILQAALCPSRPGGFTDCAPTSGIFGEARGSFPSHGAVGDFDEDGLPDAAYTSTGNLALYRNRGKMQFERTEILIGGFAVSGVSVGDLDHDGHLDLVVCEGGLDNRAVKQGTYQQTIAVWLGDGHLHFRDASAALGFGSHPVASAVAQAGVVCMGAALADLNSDGRLDAVPHVRSLFQAMATPVQAWVSQPDGTWREEGAALFAGATTNYNWSNHWDGERLWVLSAAHDGGNSWVFARTGTAPLAFSAMALPGVRCPMGAASDGTRTFVTDNEAQHLYAGILDDQAPVLGASCNPTRGSRELGFSPAFLDADLDGELDLFVGAGEDDTYNDPPWSVLLRGAGGKFVDASWLMRQAAPAWEQGLAVADFDRDGRSDLLTGAQKGTARLLRNEVAPVGRALAVRLRGRASNTEGIGARVTVGGETQVVGGGGTTWGESEHRPIFGLGVATEADVEVRWPSGALQRLSGVPAGELVVAEP